MQRLLRSLAGATASASASATGSHCRSSGVFPPKFPLGEESKLCLGRVLTLYDTALSRCGIVRNTSFRCMTTVVSPQPSPEEGNVAASPELDQPQRIKFKRLDKTAKHIMNILDKESVEKVRSDRIIPDIRPGYILQLKVEVPENKRRVSILKGIVIAKRNAGLHSTFRLRRLVAGVGVESVFPLYSPNIKEMKVLDKKRVRRAKLYYLRDRMNALKK
ncbi:50S ribosomal protein L19-2, chloroplastic-like [Iris pallida]|uniref:50S ribosomal protein L19-2, chloroplastic-like n=1 Tax=Iris pallida TaxID=29817 RepID=A0AAX6HY14_IRIPA|nr:50S ribosomal protein L19-2, chloroplastic-like [Iris pallida]KAJ6845125.1 50S ribosomal protein L19-2, chloroplastic-like [Iris pallida]